MGPSVGTNGVAPAEQSVNICPLRFEIRVGEGRVEQHSLGMDGTDLVDTVIDTLVVVPLRTVSSANATKTCELTLKKKVPLPPFRALATSCSYR